MAQISLRIDDEVKRNAEIVCNELGVSMASAINMYLKKMGREHRIPFEISVDPFYSEDNIKRLKKSILQMETTGAAIHDVLKDKEIKV